MFCQSSRHYGEPIIRGKYRAMVATEVRPVPVTHRVWLDYSALGLQMPPEWVSFCEECAMSTMKFKDVALRIETVL